MLPISPDRWFQDLENANRYIREKTGQGTYEITHVFLICKRQEEAVLPNSKSSGTRSSRSIVWEWRRNNCAIVSLHFRYLRTTTWIWLRRERWNAETLAFDQASSQAGWWSISASMSLPSEALHTWILVQQEALKWGDTEEASSEVMREISDVRFASGWFIFDLNDFDIISNMKSKSLRGTLIRVPVSEAINHTMYLIQDASNCIKMQRSREASEIQVWA